MQAQAEPYLSSLADMGINILVDGLDENIVVISCEGQPEKSSPNTYQDQ